MDQYFQNCTNEQIKTIATYNAYSVNESLGENPSQLDYENAVMTYCGDDHVKVLHEDENNLVYMSVDTHIKVIVSIAKKNFIESTSLELV